MNRLAVTLCKQLYISSIFVRLVPALLGVALTRGDTDEERWTKRFERGGFIQAWTLSNNSSMVWGQGDSLTAAIPRTSFQHRSTAAGFR